MDSQNNPTPGASQPDDETKAPEVSVDLTSQAPDQGADPSQSTQPQDQFGMPAPDGTAPDGAATDPAAPAEDSSAIAFTTNSDGTIKAVDQPEGTDQAAGSDPMHDAAAAGSVAVSSETAPVPDASASEMPAAQAPAPDAPAADQPLMPPAPTDSAQPDATPPLADASQGLPPTMPVAAPRKDMKMIVILAIVAVVLLAAIAALVVL